MPESSHQMAILEILAAANDISLATLREDGAPQVTTVSFVNDGLKIYFGTGAQSQKARNIARDPRVAAVVDPPYESWGKIKGLNFSAHAVRVTAPDEFARVGQLMMVKFPQLATVMDLSAPPAELAVFRLDPEFVSILDYTQGFGHTEAAEFRR